MHLGADWEGPEDRTEQADGSSQVGPVWGTEAGGRTPRARRLDLVFKKMCPAEIAPEPHATELRGPAFTVLKLIYTL